MRTLSTALMITILSTGAWAQQDDTKIKVQFKDASLDALIEYLSDNTPWKFIKAKSTTKKIDAWSDTELPLSEVLEFLDTALKPVGLASMKVQNKYFKNMVIIDDDDKIKDTTLSIHVSSDPAEIPISDRMRVQVMPLQNISVKEIEKELSSMIKKAGDVSINRHANCLVISGRSADIHRLAKVIHVIDTQVTDQLKVKLLVLQNADATETAKVLNEVFKKEQTGGRNQGGFMGGLMRMFGGGRGRRGRGGSSEVSGENVAQQVIRIIPDTRTNALLVTANDENMKLVEDVVYKLDTEMSQAMKMQRYSLSNADATEVSQIITELFSSETSRNSGGRGGMPWFMGGRGGGAQAQAKGREIRAVADTRTNMVMVMAHENDFKVIDDIVNELDRQMTDVVKVQIYKLENSESDKMASILQDVFRSQIDQNRQNSRNTGRNNQRGGRGGRGNFFSRMFGGGNTGGGARSGGLPPSAEIEITSDERTNSVIVKASEQYQEIASAIIKDLDADPTETMTTYTIPLRNADATELATVLRDLLRGQSGGGNRNRNSGGNLFGLNNRNNNRNNSTRNRGGGNTRGGGGRRLGPLEDQIQKLQDQLDEMIQDQDQDEGRRSVEGQVDVQADGDTNSLVIRTSPRNFEAIQRIVDDLDRMRPQVLIKVLIAEVTLTDELQFGVEGFWENAMSVGNGDKGTNRFDSDLGVGSEGFNYMLSGDEFQASLNMFAKDGRLKVMATPRILVLDNQTANINVGKEVPIITNSQVTNQGNTINTVQYETVGILLEVTPHINPDGLVTMVIHPEISDIASEAEAVEITDGVTNPTFNVNSADTTVSVRNGNTVVIGGLIRETEDDSVNKIPILGDLPLLGALFSNTKKRKVRRELMIFLTPYVVFTAEELEELTELEKSKLKLLDERDIDSEGDKWLKLIKDHTK